MKKIVIIILCLITTLTISGCEKNNLDIGKKSTIKSSKSDVSLNLKEGTLSKTGVTIVLSNNSEYECEYGEPYDVEVNHKGEWHKINADVFFIMPMYSLKQNESYEKELNWESSYGPLPEGTYRIVKGINCKEKGNYINYQLTKEFTINKK